MPLALSKNAVSFGLDIWLPKHRMTIWCIDKTLRAGLTFVQVNDIIRLP